jgi:beta-lactamase regulating signal transducer with metallopeptidase domain
MTSPESWPLIFSWVIRGAWHGSFLIVILLLVQFTFGRLLSAKGRYCLWFVLLAKLALPLSFQTGIGMFGNVSLKMPEAATRYFGHAPSVAAQARFAVPPISQSEGINRNNERPGDPRKIPLTSAHSGQLHVVLAVLPWVWLIGVLVLAVRIVRGISKAVSCVKNKPLFSDVAALNLLSDCRKQLGLRNAPWIIEDDEFATPALFGFSVPRLLLPAGLVRDFHPDELRFIFMHELIHIRRRDIAVNWVMTMLQVIYWFNPLVWYAFSRMRSDRELVCDSMVLDRMPSVQSRQYGETILKLLERFSKSSTVPPFAGLLEGRRQMKKRIQMIVSFKKRAWHWAIPSITVFTFVCALAITNAAVPKIVSGTSFYGARAFTIQFEDRLGRTPNLPPSINGYIFAKRGDGSTARVMLNGSGKSRIRFIFLVPERKQLTVSDEVSVFSAEEITDARVQRLVSPTPDPTCQTHPELVESVRKGVTMLGTGDYLGIRVVKFVERSQTGIGEFWESPDCNCEVVYRKTQSTEYFPAETIATAISLGDPEPSLFSIPSYYKEKSAMLLDYEVTLKHLGETPSPEILRQLEQADKDKKASPIKK